MSGEFYLPEIMGPGAALLDYDGDGDLDVYLIQGRMLGPGKTLADARFPPPSGQTLSNRLLRNDLAVGPDGSRHLHFTDVTASSGAAAASDYGMGVASGDFDNDGRVDLYLTNFGRNRLLRNRGDGTFEDVTAHAGVGDPGWSVSAAFLDYDHDGWLDLYVGDYVAVDLEHHKQCKSPSSAVDYCTPLLYRALTDHLYHNRGDGTFDEVSGPAGISAEAAPALGVVAADFNLDGWPDVYAADDSTPNQLWLNQHDGTFRDDAVIAGAAVNMAGVPQGSMGLAVGDFDNDGDDDLFMTHVTGETNTIYVNDGHGWFEDRSIAIGLGPPSKPFTGFGTGWLDVDNDGWLDVFVGNGEISLVRALSDRSGAFPLGQPNQLFMNRHGTGFEEVTAQAGSSFRLAEISRGTAFGDIDNDGDTDILVLNNNGPARLLLNTVGQLAPWLGLRVLDRSGRDALGARVELRRRHGASLWRTVHTDGSYASASDPRVLFGLGEGSEVLEVRVHWPQGGAESWRNLPLGHYTTLRYGTGKTEP